MLMVSNRLRMLGGHREMHRSIFFVPFAINDSVKFSLSVGDATLNRGWAWLWAINSASFNKLGAQFVFSPSITIAELQPGRQSLQKGKTQPDLEHFLSKIVQHSRLGPKERESLFLVFTPTKFYRKIKFSELHFNYSLSGSHHSLPFGQNREVRIPTAKLGSGLPRATGQLVKGTAQH